jgi:hypothetical protein
VRFMDQRIAAAIDARPDGWLLQGQDNSIPDSVDNPSNPANSTLRLNLRLANLLTRIMTGRQ